MRKILIVCAIIAYIVIANVARASMLNHGMAESDTTGITILVAVMFLIVCFKLWRSAPEDERTDAIGITYTVNGYAVTFSDGAKGKAYSHSGASYYFITEDEKRLVYSDIDLACNALYEYLTTKSESKLGFIGNYY